MDNDVILSQFDNIETKVEFLIELCKSFEAENKGLKSRIEMLERDIKDKSGIEQRYTEQKEKIRNKIEGLIKKIDQFTENSS